MTTPLNLRATLPCSTCRAIIPDRTQLSHRESSTIETQFEREDVYPTYPSIALSAQAGCTLCVLMLRKLTATSKRGGDTKLVWLEWERRTGKLNVIDDPRVKIRVTFDFLAYANISLDGSFIYENSPSTENDAQRGGAVTSMSVHFDPIGGPLPVVGGGFWGQDLHATQQERRRELPSSITLSDANVAKIKEWIGDCMDSHAECSSKQAATSWVPRRLLEIDDGDHGLEIRLIETSEISLPIRTQFAALSHVWGDIVASPPLRLLSSNLSRLKNGILELELPKNFADAVHDSKDDWREQAALMHLVYSHALVTIVATSATSCHEGFLERRIDSIPKVKIAYCLPTSDQHPLSDHRYMIIYDYIKSDDIWRTFAINGSKWNTRAWTMQERSLSTRMIHFCRNKIFFECRGCLRSEENEPVQESDVSTSNLWPRATSVSSQELLHRWQLFVSEYTTRNLTVATDRLPALQSIAEELATATGEIYIHSAGMWLSNLRKELLWNVAFGEAKRPDVWRAPSWSWAAVEGEISLFQRNFRDSQQSLSGSLLNCLSEHKFQTLEVDQECPSSRRAAPGYLIVKSLTKQFSRLRKNSYPKGRRTFFPYDLIADDSSGRSKLENDVKVFAHRKLDFEDFANSMTSSKVFLYLHINDDARATGLIVQAMAYGYDRIPYAWSRVGTATLFLDRSATPILNDVFKHEDISQEILLI
ncbi:hypothetical protein NPX13_g9126 [Xylaria arbuscula]|uniref:Heterokaryon incompatibility domain-containing protein n=1 Tax=Xylaria arbuscula TaxID=114810 RepID=A0A9W8THS7_9PEZI|nr:hypothetical protein NPX13_g9126 [Xylaria arbuscula]